MQKECNKNAKGMQTKKHNLRIGPYIQSPTHMEPIYIYRALYIAGTLYVGAIFVCMYIYMGPIHIYIYREIPKFRGPIAQTNVHQAR